MMPRSNPREWVRARARRLPPLAWRDARIRELRAERRRLAAELAAARKLSEPTTDHSPSFARYVYAERRINAHIADRNVPGRAHQIARKLKAYSFAQSHGVRIPTMLGLWDQLEHIAWDELPDEIVLKSNTGASSRGVFPLRRIDGRWFMVTRREPIEPADIVEQLTALYNGGRVDGPFFGQELIGKGRDDALPTEVRVYCFYGEAGVVNVRRATSHGDNTGTRARRFLPDGSPGPRHVRHDDDIELPDAFHRAVDIARRLSGHVPRPLVRVDFLDDDGDAVFGELTPRPGGPHYFGRDDDRRLGELWEQAQARILNDVIDGSDYALRYGPGPRELLIGDYRYLPDQGWVAP
jgi:teichuronopeptide biosynthesis TupA-like protein